MKEFTPVLSSGSHQATCVRAPYDLTQLYTYGLIEQFAGLHMETRICKNPARRRMWPWGARTDPLLSPHGPKDLTGQFSVFSYASVTSNHRPRTILAPVRCLTRKAEWRNLRRCYRQGHIKLHVYGHRTTWHSCTLMVWSNNSQDSTWRPEFAKIPHGIACGREGPVRTPCCPRTGCSRFLNPYGAREFIMQALKLYGPRAGRRKPYFKY